MKILDATASYRGFWMDKHNRYTTFIDIRPEVKPDLVMDAAHTTFADKTFDIIIFDPPHKNMGREATTKSTKGKEMRDRYGSMDTPQRNAFVKAAFIEFHRILKDDGLVFFKWNSCGTAFEKIIKLRGNFRLMFGQNFNSIKHYETTWVCMCKDYRGSQKYIGE